MTKLARLTNNNGPFSFYIMAEKVLAIYIDDNGDTIIDTDNTNRRYLVNEDPDTAAAIIEKALKPVFVFGDINSEREDDNNELPTNSTS